MRKGLGKGKGKGYKNIIGKDQKVHSQSARGIKQPQKIPNMVMKDSKKKPIDVFNDFFEETLQRDMEWYENLKKRYNEIQNDYPKPKIPNSMTSQSMEAYRKARSFISDYPLFIRNNIGYGKTGDEVVRKVFLRDLEIRKQNMISKIEKVVGEIESVKINRNPNGGFDGLIIGNKGKARIETIGAGGYNIQRYHYRTLVKPLEKNPYKDYAGYVDYNKTDKGDIVIYDNKYKQTGIDSGDNRWVISNETKGTHVVVKTKKQAMDLLKNPDF